ncbi:MAG: hypothetical protein A2736_00310 [Candidatus Yanofskybacteria bacterium RIFCSPHIGHO2_01_FULL_41_27]|uniref:Uncharacterized protein n=3 Tax=Candidatus Yanofskyibacteriota TaxID=1752733 RepID=A0A1F8HVA7_9BACT|nr:MAG: hypothetical protein UU84_C0018G0003 [Candidatus Yanofskybacteria bacterium GW2011_GWC2_41_9]OGM99160.1 MAG: hypothetical protein A2736_00310 [Candidatus Yanofskybacteria bacterium RIFCSPHIGHO2_01_FULL_41_27]OGN41504.1 MAG: hypothetical protein A2606_03255 [Candidatus Yanofskybacteria bacterium RIFOXYD1_FULL_42_10]
MNSSSVLGNLVLSHLPANLTTGLTGLVGKLDDIATKLGEIVEILKTIDKKLNDQNRTKQKTVRRTYPKNT